ncbi:hypothetical protein BLA24_28790 [Streptomyces cinnamoneus]|uniref:Uncharacterized protein n=1 Tax=Streptomyces cinnamoneus TaxID=53446 RepID=A0A2G1XC16_STRCJ|nr:hypothetical protein BLA24_28790 [Streptomyces cinnamoneus]PPT16387.1 hypothetical protein CYQ11_06675 [Streptomyces cinnamoneus]
MLLLTAAAVLTAAATPRAPDPRREAECHTRVRGSHVTASCYNGNATTDRVQLHVTCARWWDPAMDTAVVDVGPARRADLAQRCWLEVRDAWVTHDPG